MQPDTAKTDGGAQPLGGTSKVKPGKPDAGQPGTDRSLQHVAESAPNLVRLGRVGRAVRVLVALAGVVLLIGGALVGQDDDFPFGPFRMYSTADKLNAPVRDTRLDAVNAAGQRFTLTDDATGFRRAELEGQLSRFRRDPQLLGAVAEAYQRRQPDRPRLTRIAVVIRWLELHDGRPTGRYTEQTAVSWTAR
jgi:hypothetical protein